MRTVPQNVWRGHAPGGDFCCSRLYALDHNMERLAEDHRNARLIAGRLATSNKINVDLSTVQTNILIFELTADAPDAATVVSKAQEHGLLIFAFGPRVIRAVTHLNVSKEDCKEAAAILLDIVSG